MMRRKLSIRDRMIEAAVELFAEQGFAATTTREIARRARINEVSIYRYFPGKQKLFWAALQSRMECLQLRDDLQSGLAQDWEPEQLVPLMIRFLLETRARRPELMRLLYVSLVELGPRAARLYEEYMGPTFHALSAYLRRGVESGRLRSLDPSISGVAIMSTVLAHEDLHTLFTGKPTTYFDMEQAVTAYSSFWLSVLVPAPVETAARPS